MPRKPKWGNIGQPKKPREQTPGWGNLRTNRLEDFRCDLFKLLPKRLEPRDWSRKQDVTALADIHNLAVKNRIPMQIIREVAKRCENLTQLNVELTIWLRKARGI